MIYTGIGCTKTPDKILRFMELLSARLSEENYLLRSGGAPGADDAFETNAKIKHIFLPWKGFNNKTGFILEELKRKDKAEKIASTIHPVWDRLSRGQRLFHVRNIFQVLGRSLKNPSDVTFAWAEPTMYGVKGGTNTAYTLSLNNKIPTYNFAIKDDYKKIKNILNSDKPLKVSIWR